MQLLSYQCLRIYIYIYIYFYLYVYVNIYIYIYIYIYLYLYIHIYIYTYIDRYIRKFKRIHISPEISMYGLVLRSGDVDFPGTYNYDVLFRVVPGFTFAMAQSGQLSEDVEQEIPCWNVAIWYLIFHTTGILTESIITLVIWYLFVYHQWYFTSGISPVVFHQWYTSSILVGNLYIYIYMRYCNIRLWSIYLI